MRKSTNFKKNIFLYALLLGAALFIVCMIMLDKQGVKKVIVAGDQAPEFQGTLLDGRKIGLSDLRGKVVMVHFWATWCPPCVEEMPALDRMYRHFQNKDFELIAVNVDEGVSDAVPAFLKNNKITIPVLLDARKKISGLYGTYKLPETYIVDRKGIVRYKVIGPRNWEKNENIRIIQSALDGQ